MDRRHFLQKTAAATAGLALRPQAQPCPDEPERDGQRRNHRASRPQQGPSHVDRPGPGTGSLRASRRIANVRITHVVDIDERHFSESLSAMKQKYGGDPKTETDFRRVLDNRDVDAVTIAAPDHWHALMTIWACQAGKDVYVEKPISHNIVEGRRMIDAARRYNRIVQVGTQRRSGAVLGKAVQFLRDGGLGTVYAGKTVVYRPRDPIGVVADSPVPPGVQLRSVARAGAVTSVQRKPFPLSLALVLGIRHDRPW